MGNYIAISSAIFMVWFMAETYPVGHVSSPSQRAQMDALIANMVPLSVADLGMDAEDFMNGGQE